MLRSYQDLTINHTVDSQNTLHSFFSLSGEADAAAVPQTTTPATEE